MTNRHGSFIWYELMTPDPDGSKAFYDAVVGWDIEAKPSGELDYRMITIPGGGNAGGVMRLTDDMTANGARPIWLGYVGVDDVDDTVTALKSAGGGVILPPWSVEGVGRMAMVRDPVGTPFYVMRGASDADSDAFSVDALGHVGWNELSTSDLDGARHFYPKLFGWIDREFMDMGPMGEYRFLDHHGTRLGAMCGVGPGSTPGWRYYFRVESVGASIKQIEAGGGSVVMGPHDVPTGDTIVIAKDPHGAEFSLVGGK